MANDVIWRQTAGYSLLLRKCSHSIWEEEWINSTTACNSVKTFTGSMNVFIVSTHLIHTFPSYIFDNHVKKDHSYENSWLCHRYMTLRQVYTIDISAPWMLIKFCIVCVNYSSTDMPDAASACSVVSAWQTHLGAVRV